MSEEVSSSSAVPSGSKHAREEDGEVEAAVPAKKQRQDPNNDSVDDGPCSSSSAGKSGGGGEEGGSGEGAGKVVQKKKAEEEEGGGGEGGSGEDAGKVVEKKAEEEEGGGEVSGVGVPSESDEEYQLGGSDSEGGLSDGDEENEGESSDISAEEEEEFDEEETVRGATNIVCGKSIQLREIKDGKYRLYHEETGREIKVLLPLEASTEAEKLSHKLQSDNQIPVLDAQSAEVTRNEGDEVIVYAQSLTATDDKYLFHGDDPNDEITDQSRGILLQGNKLVVLRVKGLTEVFATGDFNTEQEIED